MRWLDTEDLLWHSGYSHVFQAILPPRVTKMNVSMWVLYQHALMDQQPSVYNHITEPRHVKRSYDSGERVRHAALRKAAPVVGSYQVGYIVSCCREARAGEHGLPWTVGSRLIGFEKDRNSLGETQPRTCWVICDSVPVCVAVVRLRPCTSPELLAFQYTQTKGSSPLTADAQT